MLLEGGGGRTQRHEETSIAWHGIGGEKERKCAMATTQVKNIPDGGRLGGLEEEGGGGIGEQERRNPYVRTYVVVVPCRKAIPPSLKTNVCTFMHEV